MKRVLILMMGVLLMSFTSPQIEVIEDTGPPIELVDNYEFGVVDFAIAQDEVVSAESWTYLNLESYGGDIVLGPGDFVEPYSSFKLYTDIENNYCLLGALIIANSPSNIVNLEYGIKSPKTALEFARPDLPIGPGCWCSSARV